MEKQSNKIASDYWSRRYKNSSKQYSKAIPFWEFPLINRHINKKICGISSSKFGRGTVQLLENINKGKAYKNAVSVGCGAGQKEIELIELGVVEKFTLIDIAEYPLEKAKALAKTKNVYEKITFLLGDAFEMETQNEKYDLVYWNSSLHHMPDVKKAMKWSYNVLKKGGVFFMFEYIGPNRMQYSKEMVDNANFIRNNLPKRFFNYPGIHFNKYNYLKIPIVLSKHIIKKLLRSLNLKQPYISKEFKIPDVEKLILKDPSEAVDSENILPEIRNTFSNNKIIFLGGNIYSIALSGILHNFKQKKDYSLLNVLLYIDDLLSEKGENLFATCYAAK